MDEEPNVDDEESGEPKIQMRNVKTRENKTIDVGDGLVEDYSSKSKIHVLSPRFYPNSILWVFKNLDKIKIKMYRIRIKMYKIWIKLQKIFYPNFIKILLKNFPKGPSLYYVRVFWGFLEPPTPYVATFIWHKVRQNCHFLDQPPTPMPLRNIKIVPNLN